MESLKSVDEVAYVRFASVYRQFTDVETFLTEIEGLLQKAGLNKIKGVLRFYILGP